MRFLDSIPRCKQRFFIRAQSYFPNMKNRHLQCLIVLHQTLLIIFTKPLMVHNCQQFTGLQPILQQVRLMGQQNGKNHGPLP
ncbi:hypothetical protein L1987_65155 [Smallanthus sonchifolius]|uniref:Uncharacterized protein n=1 Tax=Smallanthus sonchifolius TaxID=185202 RepID=A0ACB9BTK7_9ASTR|nr:hypothetical protein L1987_65155 [Smallanthus sonchifolius]